MAEARFPLDFTFRPRRVLHLTRNLLAFQWKSLATTAAALAGSYIFFYICTVWTGGAHHTMESTWGAVALVLGWVLAAGAFTDIHRASRATWWFLLPASLFEKFVTTVVLTVAALVVAFPLLGLVSDLLARTLTLVLWHQEHPVFNPFYRDFWWCMATSLALMPAFFFGSVLFKKLAFLKTLLSLFGILVALGAGTVGLVWLMFSGSGVSLDGHWDFHWDNRSFSLDGGAAEVLSAVLFFGVLPAFFLAAAFLRLTESEVGDGVS